MEVVFMEGAPQGHQVGLGELESSIGSFTGVTPTLLELPRATGLGRWGSKCWGRTLSRFHTDWELGLRE